MVDIPEDHPCPFQSKELLVEVDSYCYTRWEFTDLVQKCSGALILGQQCLASVGVLGAICILRTQYGSNHNLMVADCSIQEIQKVVAELMKLINSCARLANNVNVVYYS